MKKITMRMTNVNASSKTVELVCEWLSIPKVKSFDVIAFRFSANVVTLDLEKEKNIEGKQIYDGKAITYSYDSDNIKRLNNGLGISMNIVDSTSSSLKCTFKVVFATKQDPFFVYGTYQHAVSNVSLRESKEYKLGYLGLGNVLCFDEDIIDEYDDTPGLSVFNSYEDTK